MHQFCLFIVFLSSSLSIISGQQLTLDFQLMDGTTDGAISGAHLFIMDASLGTISNSQGKVLLVLPHEETQSLIISHVSYETIILSPDQYRMLVKGEQVFMFPKRIEFVEIELTGKRSKKWKKNFKKFSKALLGEGMPATKCEILNPEVLRFDEKDGDLVVTAVDLLKVNNDYLGYDINFLLDELIVEADGSTHYKGYGQFIDQYDSFDTKLTKTREKAYSSSLSHFLRSLLSSNDSEDLKDLGYNIGIQSYIQGTFKNLQTPEPNDIIQVDSLTGHYQLAFPEFLTIYHLHNKGVVNRSRTVSISAAEQQKFGSGRSQSIERPAEPVASRLFKIEPYLVVDERGLIINKSAVKEYGFWAEQRLATTLPIDFKSFSKKDIEINKVESIDTLQMFIDFMSQDEKIKKKAYDFIYDNWSDGYIAPLVDVLRFSNYPWQVQSIETLFQQYVPDISMDFYQAKQYLWEQEPSYRDYYIEFKSHLYHSLDTTFYTYFNNRSNQSKIRIDEIMWGGVQQDGIPPLRKPKMINSLEAGYLSDTDVVFGLVVDGDARAYPQRILAWHEFFTDEISDKSLAGVYCTLCGTVVIYDTEVNGVRHDLGTSGFLYRSNKLMYDKATQSLWSTMMGEPVLGPLVGQGIALNTLPVVTTTWGEWKQNHPMTQVLSLETGHDRNYNEGEAYKDYYATDALMFPVPQSDNRLANKASVFIPRTDNFEADPLAISVDYLKRKAIHQDTVGEQRIIILTSQNGASRAYAINDYHFKSYKNGVLKDDSGNVWEVHDKGILGQDGVELQRIPSHESFWFAWFNAFPHTRLIL